MFAVVFTVLVVSAGINGGSAFARTLPGFRWTGVVRSRAVGVVKGEALVGDRRRVLSRKRMFAAAVVLVLVVVVARPVRREIDQAHLRRDAIRRDSRVLDQFPFPGGALHVNRSTTSVRNCETCGVSGYLMRVAFDLPPGSTPNGALAFFSDHVPAGWRAAVDADCPKDVGKGPGMGVARSQATSPSLVPGRPLRLERGRGSEWFVSDAGEVVEVRAVDADGGSSVELSRRGPTCESETVG